MLLNASMKWTWVRSYFAVKWLKELHMKLPQFTERFDQTSGAVYVWQRLHRGSAAIMQNKQQLWGDKKKEFHIMVFLRFHSAFAIHRSVVCATPHSPLFLAYHFVLVVSTRLFFTCLQCIHIFMFLNGVRPVLLWCVLTVLIC